MVFVIGARKTAKCPPVLKCVQNGVLRKTGQRKNVLPPMSSNSKNDLVLRLTRAVPHHVALDSRWWRQMKAFQCKNNETWKMYLEKTNFFISEFLPLSATTQPQQPVLRLWLAKQGVIALHSGLRFGLCVIERLITIVRWLGLVTFNLQSIRTVVEVGPDTLAAINFSPWILVIFWDFFGTFFRIYPHPTKEPILKRFERV